MKYASVRIFPAFSPSAFSRIFGLVRIFGLTRPARFEKDNDTWQDGAVFIELPGQQTWTAIFIAFQTETWNTDNNGNPQ